MQANLTILQQYVYMIDRGVILNVFDCINNVTKERDVYYIQKGGSEGTITFRNGQAMYIPPRTPSSSSTESTQAQPPSYQRFLLSTREVTNAELLKLAELLQTDWRKLVLTLNMDEAHCDRILRANMQKTLTEKVLLCLQYWKSSAKTSNVGVLARGLEAAKLKHHITPTFGQ